MVAFELTHVGELGKCIKNKKATFVSVLDLATRLCADMNCHNEQAIHRRWRALQRTKQTTGIVIFIPTNYDNIFRKTCKELSKTL